MLAPSKIYILLLVTLTFSPEVKGQQQALTIVEDEETSVEAVDESVKSDDG